MPPPHLLPILRRHLLRGAARALAGAALAWGAVGALAAEGTAPAPLKLRVVGGLAGVTQYTHLEAPFWTRDLARLSGGRYTADIVPFDRAGVPGNDMLRLLQLGVVPFGTVLLSSLSAQLPQYTAADLPGLNPDMATLRDTVATVRPGLAQTLRSEQGIELLAIYVYPAQVLFCREPMAGLGDLRGRVVRVASAAQGDFMTALGAKPRIMPFSQLAQGAQAGAMDCLVTGTMSGNTLGLDRHMHYLHPMPITWGLAIFGANHAAWEALPGDLRSLLIAQLPRLETAIWTSADEETAQGVACNVGSPACTGGRRGAMKLVPASPQDDAYRREVLRSAVLPQWVERCGKRCAELWRRTLGPARGIPLVLPP